MEQNLALFNVCSHCRCCFVRQVHFAQAVVGRLHTFVPALRVSLRQTDTFDVAPAVCTTGET